MRAREILVIGIGNALRGDDGLGCAVAKALQGESGLDVQMQEGEPAALMAAWEDHNCVILVDAVSSGAAIGTVFRFDLGCDRLPDTFRHTSTHSFGLAEAVELARVLGRLPPQIVFLGIEGGNFSTGAEISPEIRNAIGTVLRMIKEEREHA